jgi:hypothetical protein
MTDPAQSAKPPAAAIYALTIERFRGITSLKWKPSRGVNVILGGGDVGKTTILEAIALLFSPVNPTTLSDRDLRLVQGSALDRLLSDKGLRSRMASELAKNDVKKELTTEAQTALKNLDTAFQRESLPIGIDLAITGGQGASIASMIGLTADRYGIQLPLASWGGGTRRLSALAIAEQNQGDAPITLVDEMERGLETLPTADADRETPNRRVAGVSDHPQPGCHLARGDIHDLVCGSYLPDRAARRDQDREAPQDRSGSRPVAPRHRSGKRDRTRIYHGRL